MTLSLFVLFCALIGLSQSGKVQPIGRTPILVSSNNINEVSSYTFTFVLDTPTTAGDLLVIKFPLSQYGHLVTGTTCSAYLNPESFRPTKTALDCSYTADKQFVITLVELNSGSLSPHKVTIESITNPSSIGGTGNFQVETRRGLANTIDFNGAFNQLGFVAAPTGFTTSTATLTANPVINQNGTYRVDLTTSQVIPSQGFILLTFPSVNQVFSDYTCTVTPATSTCTRLDSSRVRIDFSADVPAGAVSITLTKILNYDYAGVSGNLKIQSWTNSVNTILEQISIAMPTPTAGTISGPPSAFYTNFQQTGLTLVASDFTSYEVSFRVVNPVPNNGAVEITFPMAPTYCVPYAGLNDISETQQATCTISGNKVRITSFRSLAYNQLLTVLVRATNPSATGATSSLVIETFKDSSATQKIDQLNSGFTFTISSTITKMRNLVLALSASNAIVSSTWTINWQNTIQLDTTTVGNFEIVIPSGFTYSTAPVCQLKPAAAGSPTTVPCTYTSGVLTLTTSSVSGGVFSATADNTLIITGFTNAKAGDYPIIVRLREGAVLRRTQTLLVTITSAISLGAVVSPLTLDRARWTLYEVAFNAPEALAPGIFPDVTGDPKTTIRLEFQTAQGTTTLFANDLGRNDTTTGSRIPCYGADALKPFVTNGKLRCILYFASASSATTPAVIEVHDFAAVASGQRVTLQIPKIRNSDSRTVAPSVAVYLKNTKNHITTVTYTNSYSLPMSVLDAVVGSPNNNNGVNGVPTNLSPTFNPRLINQVSRAEVKLTPGPGRALAAGSKVILDFPLLPYDSSNLFYVFGSTTRCEIGLGTNQPCLVFPEVGWIVIKNLVSAFLVGQEYSLTIFNINNPPSAAALNGALRLVTISGTSEYEEYFYTSFNSPKTGSLSNINIFPSRFEANQVDVEYNWIFVTSNPIKEGGSIELRFPPNLYNLESDPPVTGTVVTGLTEGASGQITFSFIINVVTIKGFAAVPAGTLIRISIKGVRNPIEATRTTNFGIVTKDSQAYIIDSELLITGLNILKANPVGVIVFNYFYTTPSNGLLRGNYYLSFYPQTDYPKGTTIQVIFPATEFEAADFKYTTCSISGALTTFKSCTALPTTFRYEIVTDTKLEIEPGMSPINLFFPQIINFNEELSSGVINVRAIYDGVVLDESGNAEDNRKAATSLASKTLAFSGFSYTPTTEGQSATYQVTLSPLSSFGTGTVIQFEFPFEYQRGLGEGVKCQVPALEISSDLPIKCVVQDRIVNITNHKGFDKTVLTNFVVSISGIVNPNSIPAVTGKIAVFLLTTSTYASENVLSLGNLAFTAPPKILNMNTFGVTSDKTRVLADYSFTLSPTVNIAATSTLITEFSSAEYNIGIFSKNPTLTLNGVTTPKTPLGNFILHTLTAAIATGASASLTLTNLANPQDDGEKRYPTIYIRNDATSVVDARTYDNLIKPPNFVFSHGGELIIMNNDLSTEIHPGQADKYTFKFSSPTTQPLTITPNPLSSNFIVVSAITVPTGSTEASIWIGVQSEANNDDAYIEWIITGDTVNRFWVIRPLRVDIVVGQTEIFVEEIVHVPAGGRTKPIYVTLSKSPLTDLTVLLYQRGSIPTYVNVYPTKLVFKKGELSKPFWVSSGKDTKGIMGSIMFLINGTNAEAYYMPKRLRSFIVSRGDTTAPLLFRKSLVSVGETSITVSVTTSEPCTVYYFAALRGTLAPLFQDIKDKKIRYDYYGGEYVVGEYVSDVTTNQYLFDVNGLKSGSDYDVYFYIEDFSGNLGSESFQYQFTTNQDYPQQIWLNILTSVGAAELAELVTKVASLLEISASRLETDLTVTDAKPNGDTTSRFNNEGRPNRRTMLSSTSYSAPNPSSGVLASFIVFPAISDPFELSNLQVVNALAAKLDALNTLYNGGNKIGVSYGVKNHLVEPKDIKWGSGISVDVSTTTSSITLSGLKLNAPGKISALAIIPTRPVYYSTQTSLQSAVRYLVEDTDNSLSHRQRILTSAYGQQQCVASKANEVTVSCDGDDLPAADRSRDDYDFYNTPPLPTSYQVARESDGSYFKGDGIAQATYSGSSVSLTLSGLKSGTKYTVYIAATDGYDKYPMQMLDQYIISMEVQTVSTEVLTVGSAILTPCLTLLFAFIGLTLML